MPTFGLVKGYILNMLSYLLPDAGEYLRLQQPFHTLMLLWEDGKHLCFDGLYLLIQLLEPHHLAPVLMYLGL